MKKFIILIALACFANPGRAQQKVKASDIIALINEGKAVSYKDAVIEGSLISQT